MYVTGICRISIFRPNKQSLVSLQKSYPNNGLEFKFLRATNPFLGDSELRRKSHNVVILSYWRVEMHLIDNIVNRKREI